MTAATATTRKSTTKTIKTTRKRKPRRQLPENLDDLYIPEGQYPTVLDVVSGRGGGSNHHNGNQRYWRKILASRPTYKLLKDDKGAKTKIADSIVAHIKSTGGRFLQKDAKTARWFVLPDKIALDKIKQALRDKYVPEFARTENSGSMPSAARPQDQPSIHYMPSSDVMAFASSEFEDFIPTHLRCLKSVQQQHFKSGDEVMKLIEHPPSLNFNDILANYAHPANALGQFNSSSFPSFNAFKSMERIDWQAYSSREVFVSKDVDFNGPAHHDEFKIAIGHRLPDRSVDTTLKGHSLDVPERPRETSKKSYFNTMFENAFANTAQQNLDV